MRATAKQCKKATTVPSIPSGNRMLLLSDEDEDEEQELSKDKLDPILEEEIKKQQISHK